MIKQRTRQSTQQPADQEKDAAKSKRRPLSMTACFVAAGATLVAGFGVTRYFAQSSYFVRSAYTQVFHGDFSDTRTFWPNSKVYVPYYSVASCKIGGSWQSVVVQSEGKKPSPFFTVTKAVAADDQKVETTDEAGNSCEMVKPELRQGFPNDFKKGAHVQVGSDAVARCFFPGKQEYINLKKGAVFLVAADTSRDNSYFEINPNGLRGAKKASCYLEKLDATATDRPASNTGSAFLGNAQPKL